MNCSSGSQPFGFQGPPLSKTIIDGPPMICTSVTFVVLEIIINLNKQTHVSLMLYIFIVFYCFYILIQIIRLLKTQTIKKLEIFILFSLQACIETFLYQIMPQS